MLSLTCKTAVKAVVFLATKVDEKAGIREIAAYIEASEHTVGKMLQTLVKQKLSIVRKARQVVFILRKNKDNSPFLILCWLLTEPGFSTVADWD